MRECLTVAVPPPPTSRTVARLQYGAIGPEHNITGVRFKAGSKASLGVSGTGFSVRGLDSIHVKRAR